jgi:cytochrome c oxidase subunit IV
MNTFDYFRVAAGRRRSLIIFSMIIAVVLIIATFVTPVFVILKNLTARQKGCGNYS